MKKCTGCDEVLPLSSFSKHAKNKDGLQQECKACNKTSSSIWRKENKDVFALKRIKERAKEKGLDFNLTREDIQHPPVCPVFGFTLERSNDGLPKKNSPSVDRIDPNKGYTKDNIQIISQLANAMKQNATPEQLIAFAEWVLKTYQKESK
jgi:hypothetical protein